jgi:AraC-like DNA-binding protein
MHFQYIRPSGFLAQYIRHYWILEADASDGEVCERVIPTGNIEWMFHYRNTFIVRNSGEQIVQPRSLASGISCNYFDVATRGESGVIAVTFLPGGASRFLRFPLSDLEDSSVSLSDIFNSRIKETEERVCTASSNKERIQIIEQFLTECFRQVKTPDLQLIERCVELITQTRGQMRSSDLSRRLSVTDKSLERKFSSYLGKTPKQFIRIIRFQSVIQNLSCAGPKDLTRFTYDNGYFDQAHFIKDFKSLSGYTPREFLALGPCHADYFE